MTTLDEITKEKQRLSEALARVDAQHEKLISQLSELEAAERVLARYTIGTQTRKVAPARTTTTATKVATTARGRGRRTTTARPAGGEPRNDYVMLRYTGNGNLAGKAAIRQNATRLPDTVDNTVGA